jgi:hypothetical protein
VRLFLLSSTEERSQHLHASVLGFAANARSERGRSYNDLLNLEKSAPAGANPGVPRVEAALEQSQPERADRGTAAARGSRVEMAGLGGLEIVQEERSRPPSFAEERGVATLTEPPRGTPGVVESNGTGEGKVAANNEQVRRSVECLERQQRLRASCPPEDRSNGEPCKSDKATCRFLGQLA